MVTIKSGLNWGNSSQWARLEDDFKRAMRVLGQSKHVKNVHAILGVGYGKARTTIKKGFIKQVCGQEFWNMVSGDKTLYIEIIEPLGTNAGKFNADFEKKKAEIINKLTKQFIDEFCDKEGKINWRKLIRFNSGNMEEEPIQEEEYIDSEE